MGPKSQPVCSLLSFVPVLTYQPFIIYRVNCNGYSSINLVLGGGNTPIYWLYGYMPLERV